MKKGIFVSASLACVSVCLAMPARGAVIATNTAQWTAASGGNDHYYRGVALDTVISWSDASAAATQAGGYLATITSSAENSFVFSVVDNQTYWFQSINNHGPWIGAFQPAGSVEPAGGFRWVNQTGSGTPEPFAYSNWLAGEPSNDDGTEDSVDLLKLGTGRAATWNDAANSNTFVRSYVIEFNSNPVPEPASVGALGAMAVGLLATRRRARRDGGRR